MFRRASSASLSIRPAIGTSTCRSPTSAVALSGASSCSPSTVKDSIFASFFSSASFSCRRRWSSALAFLRNSCSGLPGPMFISPRMLRTPSISSLSHSISPSAAASMRLSLATGHGCSMMVLPSAPASGARRCQISSVMNGMNGWARRRATSSTRTRVRRVPRARSTGAFSSHRTGLDNSRYQSQYWFQMNS
ncbi:hypothetical protein D3C79_854220 [compost metagenome]